MKIKFRSGFEEQAYKLLKIKKVGFEYEPKDGKITYIQPETNHTYLPDFILRNGIYIETKGHLTLADRKKHLLLKEQHPDKDIRIIFQAPHNKIIKGSKTTYAKWCDKHGIKWGTLQYLHMWSMEVK